jgi:hypothetical protein
MSRRSRTIPCPPPTIPVSAVTVYDSKGQLVSYRSLVNGIWGRVVAARFSFYPTIDDNIRDALRWLPGLVTESGLYYLVNRGTVVGHVNIFHMTAHDLEVQDILEELYDD